jgi:hypothetical protein
MEYYYLDGIDKKGPFSKEEILSKNLKNETLIFHDGISNWTPLENCESLKLPILEEPRNQENQVTTETTKTITEPQKIKIPSFLFLIFFLGLCVLLSYFYTTNKKESDLKIINSKIEDVFNGKDEICDYQKDGVRGKLQEPTLFTPQDNEGNSLVEFFECESGGWTVLSLKKVINGFEYINNYSTNMGFKVVESNYKPGVDLGYGYTTQGYSIPTYRGTVQNAYKEAMEYISVEKENKPYVAGSYSKIKTFDELTTDFYTISNVEPTKYSDGTVNSKTWESMGEASVFNKNWIVWYKRSGKHYEIIELKNVFNKLWLKYSVISGLIATLLYFLIKYRKKIALQVT